MRTNYIYILLFLCLSSTVMGQNRGRQRIESLRIAIFTKKIGLTPEESQIFWPIYNQYREELNNLNEKRRERIARLRDNFDTMSNRQMEKIVDEEIAYRQDKAALAGKYHTKFKEILPIQKVAKLYAAEIAFKRELLKRISKSSDERKNNFH